jgi:intron-binding protein aquarius
LEKELGVLPKLRQKWNALQKKWTQDIVAAGSAPTPPKVGEKATPLEVTEKEEEEEEEEEEEPEDEGAGKKRRKSGVKKAGKKKAGKKAKKKAKTSKGTASQDQEAKSTLASSAPLSTRDSGKRDRYHERTFLPSLLVEFLDILNSINEEKAASDADLVAYCDRFIEFVTDLEAQLPTRRFFHALLEDSHFVIRTQQSLLYQSLPQGYLFRQLVETLRFYQGFEVNNYTGESLTDEEMEKIHFDKIQKLQHLAFVHFREQLEDFVLAPVSAVESKEDMTRFLSRLDTPSLHRLCELLALLPSSKSTYSPFHFVTMEDEGLSNTFMMDIITSTYQRRRSQIQVINNTPLFPTEALFWNEGVIPSGNYTGDTPLALPKLNLQFLTFFDYLWRNYNLFRLESASEIKDDVEDVVRRSAPRQSPSGTRTEFTGWARMGIPIKEFKVVHVAKPDLGEKKPSRVKAEIVINLGDIRRNIRGEWDELRPHDVLFLISVRSPLPLGAKVDSSKSFPKQFGVEHVRGCEMIDINDETGYAAAEEEKGPVFGFAPTKRHRTGDKRIIRVLVDANQYQNDLEARQANPSAPDIYTSFNLLMRRKPKENNFKSVLETIRELMNTRETVPGWLHDVFLGYGNPASAINVTTLKNADFVDTLLDSQHIKESFPDKVPTFPHLFSSICR